MILSEPDPILEPIFRGMDPGHPKHVAAWLAETFGGPANYTRDHGGYEQMPAKHKNRGFTEAQRQRWLTRMLECADRVGLPADPGFRSTFVAYRRRPRSAASGSSHVWGSNGGVWPQPVASGLSG